MTPTQAEKFKRLEEELEGVKTFRRNIQRAYCQACNDPMGTYKKLKKHKRKNTESVTPYYKKWSKGRLMVEMENRKVRYDARKETGRTNKFM